MAGGKRSSREKNSSELALFLDMLMAERGAASNTVDAYKRDLSEFLAFLAAKGKDAQETVEHGLSVGLPRLAGVASPLQHLPRRYALRFRFLDPVGDDRPQQGTDALLLVG